MFCSTQLEYREIMIFACIGMIMIMNHNLWSSVEQIEFKAENYWL